MPHYDFLLVFHFCLTCTISEILSVIFPNLRRSRDPYHILTINHHTKREVKIRLDPKTPKFKKWSRDPTTPLSGDICHHWARTWNNQPIYKFKVSISTGYKYMKSEARWKKFGSLGYLTDRSRVTGNRTVQQTHTSSY